MLIGAEFELAQPSLLAPVVVRGAAVDLVQVAQLLRFLRELRILPERSPGSATSRGRLLTDHGRDQHRRVPASRTGSGGLGLQGCAQPQRGDRQELGARREPTTGALIGTLQHRPASRRDHLLADPGSRGDTLMLLWLTCLGACGRRPLRRSTLAGRQATLPSQTDHRPRRARLRRGSTELRPRRRDDPGRRSTPRALRRWLTVQHDTWADTVVEVA